MTAPTGLDQVDAATRVYTISEDLATALGNADLRQRDNILTRMSADPMSTIADYGLDDAFFAAAQPDVKEAYAAFLKQEADAAIAAGSGTGHATRDYHWFACWSCRIGIGAVIVAVGVAITAATSGAGGPIYAALVAQVAVRAGLALAAATTLVNGAITVGQFIGAGAISALIEVVCEAIPNTCA